MFGVREVLSFLLSIFITAPHQCFYMKNVFLSWAVLFLFACNSGSSDTPAAGVFVIQNVSVIPMDTETVLENHDVFIADGKITHMAPTTEKAPGKDALIIDGTGKFLIPGLAEMHAHIPRGEDTAAMKDILELFVLNGVTTIRGMLGDPIHLELKAQLSKGEITGPHFYAAAPGLMGSTVKSVKDADSLVRKYKNEGYDLLKLLPGLTLENFNAIVKTAKEVNIPFAGHVSYDVGIWNAIAAGYASVDHLDGFVESLVPGVEKIPEPERGLFGLHIARKADLSKIDALVTALKQHNIGVVPTEALPERWFTPLRTAEAFSKDPEMVYMNEGTLNNWVRAKNNIMADPLYDSAGVIALIALRKKILKACSDNNVSMISGSDAPQVFDVPGFSLHQELKYMADAGLTPFEVLQTSTVNAAAYFNHPGSGVIKPGAASDLVLLNGNPLNDITQTANIAGVLIGKQWLPSNVITQRLEALKGKIKS